MIVVRLFHWAFRRKVVRCWIDDCPRCGLEKGPRTVWIPHDRCPSCGAYIQPTYRAPRFIEALTGIAD